MPLTSPRPAKKIVLLLPANQAFAHGVIRGVARYSRPLRPWTFRLNRADDLSLKSLRAWKPDGLIVAEADPPLLNRLARQATPFVSCGSSSAKKPIERIMVDNIAVGEMAARYFLDRGFRHCAFVGERGRPFLLERGEAFGKAVQQAGATYDCFLPRRGTLSDHVLEAMWQAPDEDLHAWLKKLPRPTAILTCHDLMALRISDALRDLAIRVPDEAAVLGVDNDPMICELANPPLSSVETPQEQIGFEAARRLDRLMLGTAPRSAPAMLGPLRVVTRQSSDVMATDDRAILAAMHFIEQHADQPLRVDQVADAADISRRSLETRFAERLGRTILDEIQAAHVRRACTLLEQPNWSLERVALASGFNSRERFSCVFRQVMGQTPGTYRKQLNATRKPGVF